MTSTHQSRSQAAGKVTPCCSAILSPVMPVLASWILRSCISQIPSKTNKQAWPSAAFDSLINDWCQGAYAPTGLRPQVTISSKLSTRRQRLPTSHTTADAGQPSRAMTSSHVYEMHGPLTRSVGHVIASPLSPFPFKFLLHSVKRPRQTEADPELELWPPRSRSRMRMRIRLRFRLDVPHSPRFGVRVICLSFV